MLGKSPQSCSHQHWETANLKLKPLSSPNAPNFVGLLNFKWDYWQLEIHLFWYLLCHAPSYIYSSKDRLPKQAQSTKLYKLHSITHLCTKWIFSGRACTFLAADLCQGGWTCSVSHSSHFPLLSFCHFTFSLAT